MLFVDYQTAFDSLSRAWIWDELKVRGLPRKFLNIIKKGYETSAVGYCMKDSYLAQLRHQGSDKVAFCHHYCSCWLWMVFCLQPFGWKEKRINLEITGITARYGIFR
jgi:hypothetical protein